MAATDAAPRLLHRVLFEVDLGDGQWTVTTWKLIGYLGVGLFGLRWLPQIIASARANQSVVPTVFWLITFVGALLQTSYFFWGKNDSVGILAGGMSLGVAGYNLYLIVSGHKKRAVPDADDAPALAEATANDDGGAR